MPKRRRVSSSREHGLRTAGASDIEQSIRRGFDAISVEIAPDGSLLTVPSGWHGEGKQGEAMVLYGDLLTGPIAGTVLTAGSFVDWLSRNSFLLETGGKAASAQEAAEALESNVTSVDPSDPPVFRAVRTKENGLPSVIEVYSGALSTLMLQLTTIGNRSRVGYFERVAYKGAVASLMNPFISKGTTQIRRRMGVEGIERRMRRVDDCLAGMTTLLADALIDEKLGVARNGLLEEIAVSVATTQGMVVAVTAAELRGVPLIIRAGGPSFGLAGKEKGLNYMVNTLPDALTRGYFTAGDFGSVMQADRSPLRDVQTLSMGNATTKHRTRFFLTGGGPVHEMMEEAYNKRRKPLHGMVSVRRAARIDDGKERQWGVIISGIAH